MRVQQIAPVHRVHAAEDDVALRDVADDVGVPEILLQRNDCACRARCARRHRPERRPSARSSLHIIHGRVQDAVDVALLHVVVIDADDHADAKAHKLFNGWAAGARRADDGEREAAQALDRALIECLRMGCDEVRQLDAARVRRTRNADRRRRH